MSTRYRFEVEVSPVKNSLGLSTVGRELIDQGFEVDQHDRREEDEEVVCFWGYVDLNESPKKKHDKVLRELRSIYGPAFNVESRWELVEGMHWDEIINSKED